MRYTAENPKSKNVRVVDMSTREPIREYVIWADDETGEYCYFARDADGNLINDADGRPVEVVKKGCQVLDPFPKRAFRR